MREREKKRGRDITIVTTYKIFKITSNKQSILGKKALFFEHTFAFKNSLQCILDVIEKNRILNRKENDKKKKKIKRKKKNEILVAISVHSQCL